MKTLACIMFLMTGTYWQQHEPFEKLLALQGLWRMEKTGGFLFEQWSIQDDQHLQAKSYIIKGNDTTLLEQIQLVKQDQEIFYIPRVTDQNSGQPIAFKLIANNNSNFVFENKAHDFPQRIIYRFVTGDSLVARIEGISNGKEKGSEYYFSRVK
jgi:Domain of unknown function (DUF6265)